MAGAVKAKIDALRKRSPLIHHVMSMNEHYNKVEGTLLAGAVTYFGFLSFFPLLALGFAVVGYLSHSFPDAREHLVTAIEQIFPNIVTENGTGNTISLHDIESAKVAAGIIGLVTLLYAGLGWVSGLRNALETAFQVPRRQQPNFVVGKAIDLGALVLLGLILIVSVGIEGVIEAAADDLLDAVGLGDSSLGRPLIWTIGALLGLAASTLLFFVMYRILGRPDIAQKALWQGAFAAAVAFELLKAIVVNILGTVGGTSIASLAIAVTLVIWINYFSRITVYGAAWAMTAPAAAGAADRPTERLVDRLEAKAVVGAAATQADPAVAASPRQGLMAGFDVGSALIGAVAGAVASAVLHRRSPQQ
ncbi:MAG TPA: YihY/virulence factor BrkB family protein [Nocardioidaceae bacterium]|nr:YihY/virulence factor BrkB family protein [Nocardioidaceae bacterium]